VANQPITTAAGSIGSSGANVQVQYLSDLVIEARRNQGSPLRFVTDVSADIMGQGDTCKVWSAPNATSRLLTDGAAIVKDDDVGSSQTVTINKQRYKALSMTTVAAAMGGNAIAEGILRSNIVAVLNGVEEDVLSLATGFTNNANAGTYNTAITEAEMSEAAQVLDTARIPKPYIGLVKPDAKGWYAMNLIANFTAADHTGLTNPKFEDGYGAGRLFHGVRWYPCHAVNKTGTSTSNLVFNPAAIAIAMRMPEAPKSSAAQAINIFDTESAIAFQIVQQWDGSTLSDEIVVRVLYGYAEVNDDYGIELRS
jgi:hypothetical protein